MSYCRWSSMNGKCDVYVYEDVLGGWTTHVAMSRRIIQPIPDILFSKVETYLYTNRDKSILYNILHRLILHFGIFWHQYIHLGSAKLIPHHKIGLRYDGESFNDGTAGECADRLEHLRNVGYIVPQYAINALRGESEIIWAA